MKSMQLVQCATSIVQKCAYVVIYLVIGIILIVISQPTIRILVDQNSGNVPNMDSNVSNDLMMIQNKIKKN